MTSFPPAHDLVPFESPLAAVERLLEHFEQHGLIIGGVAASLLGQPRFTADVDVLLLLPLEQLPRLLAAAEEVGLGPRLPDALEFARRHRVLLLRHEPSGIAVDVSLGMLPFEVEAVERGVVHQAGSLRLRLPTPEDLIILKAVAHRPKDIADIQAVVSNHPHLDRARVEFWVRAMAEALDMPELWDDISALLR